MIIHKFVQSGRDYFGLGLNEVRPFSERVSYLRLSTAILLVALTIFAIINLFSDHKNLAYTEFVVAIFFVAPALLLANQPRFLSFAEYLMLTGSLLVTLALVTFGGVAGTGILWIFAYPFLAFLLKGQKIGWIVNLCWIVLMFFGVTYLNKYSGSVIYSQNLGFAPQTYAAMLFFTMLAAAFNLVRSRFESLLSEQVKYNTRKAQASLDQLQYLATHDPDTNLPNLANLYNKVETTVADDAFRGRFILVTMHLKRFIETTNILGEDNAIQLLNLITAKLKTHLQGDITIGHERHDEFLILIKLDSNQSTDDAIHQLFTSLTLDFEIDNLDIHLEYALGIASYPDHAATTDELFNRSEQAVFHAMHKNLAFSFYDAEKEFVFKRQHQLFGKLQKALLNHEIYLHYQPKFDLKSRQTTGCETLARWTDAQGENISPAEFIPIAENSGLIHAFTRSVIQQGFAQQEKWRNKGINLKMSLNLSVHNLLEEDLVEFFQELLDKHQLPASAFVLEITEGAFTEMEAELLQTLEHLRELDFKLSIDDFGTGYSSLAYLKKLPVDELKIDQSFIRDLFSGDSRDQALVKSIIQIAHNLSLSIVAEGIEDQQTEAWLKQAGCETGQGFGFSRPLSHEDFENFIAN